MPPVPQLTHGHRSDRAHRRQHRQRRRSLRAPAVLALLLLGACSAPQQEAPATPSAQATPQTEPTTRSAQPSTGPAEGSETSRHGSTLLLATEADTDALAVVDPSATKDAAIDRIIVGQAPWGVAVHAPSARAFVSTAEGVAVVDLTSRVRTDFLAYQDQPRQVEHGEYRAGGLGIAVSPDGDRVYVAVSTGRAAALETIDVASGTVLSSTPVGLRPFEVLVSADGRSVYTVDHDSFTVNVVDTTTFTSRSITVAPFGTKGGLSSWEKPHYAALDPDGQLLLPYQGQVMLRLDPATGEVTSTPTTANSHQHGIALTSDGRAVTIGNGSFGSASGGPNLSVLDLATGTEQVLPLDRRHETVAVWTDENDGTQHAALSGGYTQPGSWNGITLVDLTTFTTREITVGGRPHALVAFDASS